MAQKQRSWRFVCLVALVLVHCAPRPCAVSSDCENRDVCLNGSCGSVSCGQAVFLRDPETGICTALSGCFLEERQRSWPSCAEGDPCSERTEGACLEDSRCQPSYAVNLGPSSSQDCSTSAPDRPPGASLGGKAQTFHPRVRCSAERLYTGCRTIPALPLPCSSLDEEECSTRSECAWTQGGVRPTRTDACLPVRPLRAANCDGAGGTLDEQETACLLNPLCQPTGSRCYCPLGASCACSGGSFLVCEHNDRFLRCAEDADCRSGQRCVKGPDCLLPRTGNLAPPPGETCLGVCGSTPCDGLDENECHRRDDCTEVYATECTSTTGYYLSCPLTATNSLGSCSCDHVYQRCADREQVGDIRPERSLLIRDPKIVTDEAFRIDKVLASITPATDKGAFLLQWLGSIPRRAKLSDGTEILGREQFDKMLAELAKGPPEQQLASLFHTTALINRIDLLGKGDCGEARISFAYNGGYKSVSTRMTLIVELRVPDDGLGCRQAAQRWAELSAIEDPAERLTRLKALYASLLRPEQLAQVRTNEFINPVTREPWELREWHLVDGELRIAHARQTVAAAYDGSSLLRDWVRSNLDAVRAGKAEIPLPLLSGAVQADGQRVRLPGSFRDRALRAAEDRLNGDGCGGCHVSSTGTAFVHIGERLSFTNDGIPGGRAVISSFLRQQLKERARTLTGLLYGVREVRMLRASEHARVH